MQRIYLKTGENLELNNKIYTIESVLGDGATCVVYSASYKDNIGFSHNVNIKECYPYNANIVRNENGLVWESDEQKNACLNSFKESYEKLFAWQDANEIVNIFDICEANNTKYIIIEPNKKCVTFDKDKPETLSDILKTVKLLAHYVGKYHKNGYLHLDIKPSNFLVYPRPSEHIVLFDLDTVTAISDIETGKCRYASYSDGWAAPEQKQGKINKLCPATDIYAIGAVLFEKIMGRPVNNDDIGYFAEWSFDGKLFENVNPKIKRLLTNIFKKTLAANVKRRYQSTDKLILAIDEVVLTAEQKMYLISDCVVSDINFVGRHDDLLKIDSLFNNDVKAVFLHGFGGMGKTSLAIKYAENYGKKYDCVKFCRYSNGLKQIVDSLEIANATADNSDEHRKYLKNILKNSKTLIIIDNFDVEDDEDLEYLLSLDCNVLFTTRNDYSQYVSSKKIEIVELESLPTDALVQVFKNEYGREITDREEKMVQDIIEKFGNLTLIVPMIAKQILSSHISIEDFASSIDDDVFSRFNENNEDIRIRKDGKSHKTNSLDYLRAMFNIAVLSEEHKTTLQYLYLLRYHNDANLTIEKYREYTYEENLNILNDLAFKNWITIEHDDFRNEDNITVHQLIYDLVEKDFHPTYDSVPGIVKYIQKCFECINSISGASRTLSAISPEWEQLKHITLALLIYSDICLTDDERWKKSSILYSFMCGTFKSNPDKLYNLLFKSPEESTWYFHVHGIMDMICDDVFEEVKSLVGLYKMQDTNDLNNIWFNGSLYSFDSEREKKKFISSNGLEDSEAAVFEQYADVFPHLLMRAYFHYKNRDELRTQESILMLVYLEMKRFIYSEKNNIKYSLKFLEHLLQMCLAVCKSPRYSNKGEILHSMGFEVNSFYEYYFLVFVLIQNILSITTNKSTRKRYIKETEKIIILMEEANNKFAWYGMTEQEILDYTPVPIDEMHKNRENHWSKKSAEWYESFVTVIEKVENPLEIYKAILKFDVVDISSGTSRLLSTKSRYNELSKHNFVDKIFDDKRLTLDEKKSLIFDFACREMYCISNMKSEIKKLVKKNSSILKMYFDIFSKADFLEPDFYNHKLDSQKIFLLYNVFALRRYLKNDIPNINSYIEECISADNVEYLGELFYFADQIRLQGYIKKSQELKHRILDLCNTEDLSGLSESQLQLILYKLTPFAQKHNRKDVLFKIGMDEKNISRKYFLELVTPYSFTLTLEEQSSIACKFLDDYIEAVAIEAYNQMHNGLQVELLDEMEQFLISNIDFLLLITELSEEYCYESVFGYPNESDWHRNLHPYWACEFHDSSKLEVSIGFCYLVAKYVNKISFNNVVEESLSYITEVDGFEISPQQLETVLDNIKKIYPKYAEIH